MKEKRVSISLTMTKEHIERIVKLSNQYNISRSKLVEQILDMYIDESEKGKIYE